MLNKALYDSDSTWCNMYYAGDFIRKLIHGLALIFGSGRFGLLILLHVIGVQLLLETCKGKGHLFQGTFFHKILVNPSGRVSISLSSVHNISFWCGGTACCCSSGLLDFHSLVVIEILARTITPHWLANFVIAASGALGQPSASTSVTTCWKALIWFW